MKRRVGVNFLYISMLCCVVCAAPIQAEALSIAKKNVRSTLSGQKVAPKALNRGRGTSLSNVRKGNSALKPIPLRNTQYYTYKRKAVETPDEALTVEPFAHLQEKEDPFGVRAKQNPFQDIRAEQGVNENAVESHVIQDESRSQPFKRVPLTNKMERRFSPELQRSETLAEEVSYHHTWPIEEKYVQRVSSDFGPREHPVTGKTAFHAGIDIAAKQGTPVLASMDGRVNAIGTHARLGKYVRLDHPDGTYSLYGHLKSQKVRDGQVVLQGEVIGAVGSTGRSTGPHLDYSLRRNSQPMDPMQVLAIPEELKVRTVSSLR